MKTQFTPVAAVLLLIASSTGVAFAATQTAAEQAEIAALKAQVAAVAKTRQTEQANLTNFDDLDFNVYSGQKWDELGKSHAKDILVHYPDGHTSKGLAAHIEELKPMFVFAPDTKIKEHPIRIASGEWTAVSGTIEGTFSQPMPVGEGKTIPATGKSFKLGMMTIGHWNKAGVMDEEWLMWDNLSFMKQIGLAK
ncbi:ester cyclase [Pseudaeromonas sp. ZJS20]|uniref:ester cyclase n=1 Tax=Pseudaeromonas aegiceratis TaxID=3153928 RepID=UPI00390C4DF7